MATNTRSSKTPSFDDVTPSLGGNITSLLAIRQNANSILQNLEKDQDFGVEEYAGQRDVVIKTLKKIIATAPQIANGIASTVNRWNTIGASESPAPKSLQFVWTEEKEASAPSVQAMITTFNRTKVIGDISDKINANPLPIPLTTKTMKGLESALQAATKNTKAAEQSFGELKAKAQASATGKEDPEVKAAEIRSQLALLDQISAYNDLTSAKLLSSLGAAGVETLTWPSWGDITNFVSGAVNVIGKGAQVASAIGSISASMLS
ncbi:hypothetical protein DL96DRAFT_1687425 [Flagelloscypha sp. PMI_526]|nr:hypothetical protein DL96DRAFT_1687425 [Flagelloscypha sp. PMI_526]